MSSSYTWVRYLVGGLYLLRGLITCGFAALLLLIGVGVVSTGELGAPAAGLMLTIMTVVLAAIGIGMGAVGVGLIKGNRIALFLAIVLAGLAALSYLSSGMIVGFFCEAAICCGLLLSKDVRAAYAG